MRTAPARVAQTATERPVPDVEIVVPVYNEEAELESSVLGLRTYLDNHFPFPATVTIADNASTDGTWAIASESGPDAARRSGVRLPEKGRGRALRTVWSASDAAVVAYMDVDLATDLDALLPLVAPLVSGHSDVAIGSRLARGARRRPRAQARGHLPGLQPDRPGRPGQRLHRRPVRVQGSSADAARALLPR